MCRPEDADAVLRGLDAEAALVGASRATGAEAKSVARLVGSPAAVAACAGWARDYVTSSTTDDPLRQEHVLGVNFGEARNPTGQFRQATRAVAELQGAFALVGDTASEPILLRKCADVCKVGHFLRA